ncbi:hypothetical protein JX265_008947 [Neoarthrinium moseri]|uniref:AA1-like domain-containing protein n=1 Tax=Neoarthrinium moseri TaxID=1658444 RepID=A0A9P9WGU7_9PEZI|nr:uncharacterized protein JN550_007817 [Neoarthrinium moseri]KAI1846749.1 hypothetical protein JX266_007322 [Neoarthrinium moseri]KAI1862901.1 hypothetical protein JX265_008947 [Neoarthrinium moseri]KAI1866128.1 hypothetical protein JN550_007817 [Neoarthrinium moseri]
MLPTSLLRAFLLAATATLGTARPSWPHFTVGQEHVEVLSMRAAMPLNPAAVYDVTCVDASLRIVFHDENVAQLSICGGISGSNTRCAGGPQSTEAQSASAKFTLAPVTPGAVLNISKVRWEQCVRAARAICPTGSMAGTCRGGASNGDVKFSLEKP